MYKAQNVDTDKALEAIEYARRNQETNKMLENEKIRAFSEGVNRGLDIAEGIFNCANYEKPKEPSYEDGIKDLLYELGKEFDISIQDLRDNLLCTDELAAVMAGRIREVMKG